jgi:hypothetical protein
MSAQAKRLVQIVVDTANGCGDIGELNANCEAALHIASAWPRSEADAFWTRLARAGASFRDSGYHASFLYEATRDPKHLRVLAEILSSATSDTQALIIDRENAGLGGRRGRIGELTDRRFSTRRRPQLFVKRGRSRAGRSSAPEGARTSRPWSLRRLNQVEQS